MLGVPAAELPRPRRLAQRLLARRRSRRSRDRLEPAVRAEARGDRRARRRDGADACPCASPGDDVAIIGTFVGRDGRFVSADFGAHARREAGRAARARSRAGSPARGCSACASAASPRSRRTPTAAARSCAAWPSRAARGRRPGGATTLVSRYDGWTGVGGARAAPPFGPNAVDYFVSEAADAFFRLRQPTDEQPARGGRQPGARRARGRRRAARRPGAGRDAALRVVGDGAALPERARAVGRRRPRRARPSRCTRCSRARARRTSSGSTRRRARRLRAGARAAAVRRARTSSRAPACGTRSTPIRSTRGTILLLLAAMAIALLLGLLAVFFLAETDVRDGRGELLDLETQGAEPRALRAAPAAAAAARRACRASSAA